MGQYWICVNETKKEFIRPHMFGDGAKIMEFSCSSMGTLTAIAVLLDDGGLKEKFKDKDGHVVGRWAGDKIRFVGDYGDPELLGDGRTINPYDLAYEEFNDISKQVLKTIVNDDFIYDIQNNHFTTIQERLERDD